jgi:hypothetical protein
MEKVYWISNSVPYFFTAFVRTIIFHIKYLANYIQVV